MYENFNGSFEGDESGVDISKLKTEDEMKNGIEKILSYLNSMF